MIFYKIIHVRKEVFGLYEIFENYQNLNKQVTQAITLYNNFRIYMSINMISPNQAHPKNNAIKTMGKNKSWQN